MNFSRGLNFNRLNGLVKTIELVPSTSAEATTAEISKHIFGEPGQLPNKVKKLQVCILNVGQQFVQQVVAQKKISRLV